MFIQLKFDADEECLKPLRRVISLKKKDSSVFSLVSPWHAEIPLHCFSFGASITWKSWNSFQDMLFSSKLSSSVMWPLRKLSWLRSWKSTQDEMSQLFSQTRGYTLELGNFFFQKQPVFTDSSLRVWRGSVWRALWFELFSNQGKLATFNTTAQWDKSAILF